MKQKILKLTPEELIRTLQGNPTQQLNLPADMELIDIKYDAFTKQVTTIIRSDNFENIPEGIPIPEFTQKPTEPQQTQATTIITTISTHISDIPSTENPIQTQTNQITPQKPLIQTLATTQSSSHTNIGTGVKTLGPKPETNMDTCDFEDEFTQEQRKLLKFTSAGNFVIIKPIQFLKTEWEDINDTVKSIGGKWVKSTTIDHWAIPKNQKQEQ